MAQWRSVPVVPDDVELCVLREIFAPHSLFFLFRTTHCAILLSIFRKNNHTGEVWPTMLCCINRQINKFDNGTHARPALVAWLKLFKLFSNDFGYKSWLFSLSEKCWIRIRIRMNFWSGSGSTKPGSRIRIRILGSGSIPAGLAPDKAMTVQSYTKYSWSYLIFIFKLSG